MQWLYFNRRNDVICGKCKCSQYVYGVDTCRNVHIDDTVVHGYSIPVCMNCGIWVSNQQPFHETSWWELIILRGYNELQRAPRRDHVAIYLDEDEYEY